MEVREGGEYIVVAMLHVDNNKVVADEASGIDLARVGEKLRRKMS